VVGLLRVAAVGVDQQSGGVEPPLGDPRGLRAVGDDPVAQVLAEGDHVGPVVLLAGLLVSGFRTLLVSGRASGRRRRSSWVLMGGFLGVLGDTGVTPRCWICHPRIALVVTPDPVFLG